MSLGECKGLCWGNCSCTSCANLDIREGGSGYVLWFGNLIDIKEFTPSGGQDLYIRVAASELGTSWTFMDISDHVKKKSNFNKRQLLAILLSSAVFLMGLLVGMILYLGEDGEEMELPLFDLTTIAKATDNFSSCNKLGEGGFGPEDTPSMSSVVLMLSSDVALPPPKSSLVFTLDKASLNHHQGCFFVQRILSALR